MLSALSCRVAGRQMAGRARTPLSRTFATKAKPVARVPKADPSKDERGLLSKRDAQTLTGKSSSSTRWLQRKANDMYTRKAHEEGFVARSAYKLQQILYSNRRIRARNIVDLGASPGGWTQVALRRFRGSRVVSVDLKPLETNERGCTAMILDFLSPGAEGKVKAALGDQPADLVMSDMAPSYSGQRSVDHLRLMELSNKALTFAKKVLRPGGYFICKASTGGEEPLFKKRLQKLFEEVKFIKPDSSFKDSTEIFVVALNYQKVQRPLETEETPSDMPEDRSIDKVAPGQDAVKGEEAPVAPAPPAAVPAVPAAPPVQTPIDEAKKDKDTPAEPKKKGPSAALRKKSTSKPVKKQPAKTALVKKKTIKKE
eukprot:TRINITY_DN14434_c0_g1_i1.p1 TRINITY_DN14434_c0_g1~~TRINITY_DN14434_c0_g1_i1.p1  ORF type:complete len:370 (+),score=68.21 TRINITY_DN14434_c0_g1_i1:28-1137(+)